jgi:hypothetical protein
MGGVARSLTRHDENQQGRKCRSWYAQGSFLIKAVVSARFGIRVALYYASTRYSLINPFMRLIRPSL